MKNVCLALLVITFCMQKVSGQSITPQVVAATGNYKATGAYSLSSTTGELAVQTITSATHKLTQGFQQPNDIYLAVKNVVSASYTVDVFPNPTTSNLYVNLPVEATVQNYTLQVVDVTGRILSETSSLKEHSATILISMSPFAAGTYLLRVTDENKYASTYKIIKVQ